MMTKTMLKVFAMLAVLSSVSAVSLSAPDTTLKEMTGYRQWTRMTGAPQPIVLSSDVMSADNMTIHL